MAYNALDAEDSATGAAMLAFQAAGQDASYNAADVLNPTTGQAAGQPELLTTQWDLAIPASLSNAARSVADLFSLKSQLQQTNANNQTARYVQNVQAQIARAKVDAELRAITNPPALSSTDKIMVFLGVAGLVVAFMSYKKG